MKTATNDLKTSDLKGIEKVAQKGDALENELSIIENSKKMLTDEQMLSNLDNLNVDALTKKMVNQSNNIYKTEYKATFNNNRNAIRKHFYTLCVNVLKVAKQISTKLTDLSEDNKKLICATDEFQTFAKEVQKAFINPINRCKATAKSDNKLQVDAIYHFAFYLYNNFYMNKK